MKRLFLILLATTISLICLAQETNNSYERVSFKIIKIKRQIDSLKSIESDLEKKLDSIKIAGFNSKDTYIMKWDWSVIKKGEKVQIVKAGEKSTIVNAKSCKNCEVPTYFLAKENDYLQNEKQKKQIEQNKNDSIILANKEAQQKENENIEKRKKSIISRYGQKVGQQILDKKIWIGMTEDMLLDSWGAPEKINRTVTQYSNDKQYVYYSVYVYVVDGTVTSWQDSR